MIPSLPILCCKSSVAVKENSDSKKLLQFVLVVNYCFKALDLRYLWVPFEISRITFKSSYVKICAIWYHLYNLKSVKNTHGGVLLLVVQFQAKSLQLYLKKHSSMSVFYVFKLYKWHQIVQIITRSNIIEKLLSKPHV